MRNTFQRLLQFSFNNLASWTDVFDSASYKNKFSKRDFISLKIACKMALNDKVS